MISLSPLRICFVLYTSFSQLLLQEFKLQCNRRRLCHLCTSKRRFKADMSVWRTCGEQRHFKGCAEQGQSIHILAPPRSFHALPSLRPRKSRVLCVPSLSLTCCARPLSQRSAHVKRLEAAAVDTVVPSKVDINSRYSLGLSDIQSYRDNGFVKLPGVFDEATLQHYAPEMSLEVKQAEKAPMQQDPDYQQAFTQVNMMFCDYNKQRSAVARLEACDCTQVQNLWRRNQQVFEFVKGQRLAQIAAELLGVSLTPHQQTHAHCQSGRLCYLLVWIVSSV